MLIAREKEKNNIAEFILYMWQMEDLVRGCNMDLQTVMSKVFPDESDQAQMMEYAQWFALLIEDMQHQGVVKEGHLKNVRTYMKSVESLHHALLTVYQDSAYISQYKKADPYIKDLRRKINVKDLPETEVCLVGLYGYLMLRIRQAEISEETKEAMDEISLMVALLSNGFNKLKNGELHLPDSLSN